MQKPLSSDGKTRAEKFRRNFTMWKELSDAGVLLAGGDRRGPADVSRREDEARED
jgi:hypothetical protein